MESLGLESIATLEYPLAGPHKRSIPCVPPVYDRPKRDEERSKRIFRTVSTTAFRTSPPPPPPPPSPPPPQPLSGGGGGAGCWCCYCSNVELQYALAI
ncbi:hypothetical protein HZH66_015329 [Vespula vulgaris]|uniref:Uncharacterized protein n=1 Tax=Vespula vulgaris TaxID=7454 RepID=A0A834MLH0_VESVU|nr:hypothetical protein HZH66_015329 [Vespula vulgaris]